MDDLINKAALLGAINKGFGIAKREVLQDGQRNQRTWSKRRTPSITKSRFALRIEWRDKIARLVDHGARPHKIVATNARFLKFKIGYKRKTRIGVIPSQSGGSFGETVYRKEVQHPGFKGSQFSDSLKKRYDDRFAAIMQSQINGAC